MQNPAPQRIRLICLAYGRQQLQQYRRWAEALSEPVEVIAVDLPPKADLDSAVPDQHIDALTKALVDRLEPFLQHPHALFGQQLGAHAALALALRTQRQWPGLTRHLFVASCDSPQIEPGSNPLSLHMPMTVLYAPGSLPAMLGWNHLARSGLELIELPPHPVDDALLDLRIVRIINTHLGLLSF